MSTAYIVIIAAIVFGAISYAICELLARRVD
jgi:hypothetical protein